MGHDRIPSDAPGPIASLITSLTHTATHNPAKERVTLLIVAALCGLIPSGCREAPPPPVPTAGAGNSKPATAPAEGPFAPSTPDGVEKIPARPKIGSYLFEGCGTAHLQITRAFDEAQGLFDQGLAQLHGHWYYEAERSFRQVLATEPDCAMAHWGVAMANVHNPTRACEATAEAVYHRHRATPREQLWIDGLAAFYEITPQIAKVNHARIWFDPRPGDPPLPPPTPSFQGTLAERTRALVAHYDRLVAELPGDIEAIAFRVNQHWLNRHNELPAMARDELDAQLNTVLANQARHPAHLYRMLLWEAEDPARAEASAIAVATTAPANGNMWYWASRIFTRLKRPERALECLQKGMRADHAQGTHAC